MNEFQLEEKEQISEKLGESPDLWDATEEDEDRLYDIQRALIDVD
jgi:hypothetical protein